MRIGLSILFFLSLQFSQTVFAQTDESKLNGEKHGFLARTYPVVFGNDNDGFPTVLTVAGKIIDVDDDEPACGVLATAGTLKIKLENPGALFEDGHAYLVVFCLEPGSGKKLKNRSIKIQAKKLTKYPYDFTVSVSNGFDSAGVPFYLATGGGFGDLKKYLR
jgi:hypothetical protein